MCAYIIQKKDKNTDSRVDSGFFPAIELWVIFIIFYFETCFIITFYNDTILPCKIRKESSDKDKNDSTPNVSEIL